MEYLQETWRDFLGERRVPEEIPEETILGILDKTPGKIQEGVFEEISEEYLGGIRGFLRKEILLEFHRKFFRIPQFEVSSKDFSRGSFYDSAKSFFTGWHSWSYSGIREGFLKLLKGWRNPRKLFWRNLRKNTVSNELSYCQIQFDRALPTK